MVEYADSESSLELEDDNAVDSKVGILALGLPTVPTCSKSNGGCSASSSQSHVKSYFVGMGFSPALVDKAIEKNGEDNADLLLETLFAYSAIEKPNPESPDSLDEILGDHKNASSSADFAVDGSKLKAVKVPIPEPSDSLEEILGNCKNGSNSADFATDDPKLKAIIKSSPQTSDSLDDLLGDCMDGTTSGQLAIEGPELKEELDSPTEFNEDKRASLLMMNFSVQEVDLAIQRLGEDAPVNELVDFIVAAQVAQSAERDDEIKDQENATESLFQSMNKTLHLLEMGFTDDEISSAIEKYGAEVPVGELADSIFASRMADTCFEDDEDPTAFHRVYQSHGENGQRSRESPITEHNKRRFFDTPEVKTEPSSSYDFLDSEDIDFKETIKGKKPKHEFEDYSNAFLGPSMPGARPSENSTSSSMPSPYRKLHQFSEELPDKLQMHRQFNSNPSRGVTGMLAKPPYFFYGNVLDVSHDTWSKISQFMYAISPEFVTTQHFSALNRKEGYIHNLPTDDRSYIIPQPPTKIEDVLPHTKKWWPSWDTRKQLSCISCETKGISQLCERLGKTLIETNGMLSKEQQTDLLHQCKTYNLVWVGQYKLSPIEPEQLERILGYPVLHTEAVRWDLAERLRLLKYSFQTDTLGFHLSVLKRLYPNGLTLLSLYSGIGGAEVALHRLGLRLKGVVSVESSESNRRILRKWWQNTGQTGELVQIEDINKLTSNKLKNLIKDFGGFNVVISQNPCPNISGSRDNPAGFDFTLFFEFVRVLQSVRSEMSNR